jgi:hypothetical protein
MYNFKAFRDIINQNRKRVVGYIAETFINRENGRAKRAMGPGICFFCGTAAPTTREHVLPRWAFGKDPRKWFTTTINGQSQSYDKSTVPCCQQCNNEVLNEIEKTVNTVLTGRDVKTEPLTDSEMAAVIAWLELIDYKFQVISITRRFVAHKEYGFNDYLSDFPISVLDAAFDYSPNKVLQVLRAAMRRMGIKSKATRLNSLVAFKTHNPSFYFFNKMDDVIYLEMPHKGVAFFYFYRREFDTVEAARDAALEKIRENY